MLKERLTRTKRLAFCVRDLAFNPGQVALGSQKNPEEETGNQQFCSNNT